MWRRLWRIVPAWTLAVTIVAVMGGTAWAAYQLATREIQVDLEEPITVTPGSVEGTIVYPGQTVDFTVTNSAPLPYGMEYTYKLDNPDSGIDVKMMVDQDGPGTEFDYVSHAQSKTVNIAGNGVHYLRVICTETSAPVPGVITMAFHRKAPAAPAAAA